jgi:hypothetical protein
MAVAIKLMLAGLMSVYESSTYYRGTIALPAGDSGMPSAAPDGPASAAIGSEVA